MNYPSLDFNEAGRIVLRKKISRETSSLSSSAFIELKADDASRLHNTPH